MSTILNDTASKILLNLNTDTGENIIIALIDSFIANNRT